MLILTDLKAPENFATELVKDPSGTTGRKSRWHEIFSRFESVCNTSRGRKTLEDALIRREHPAYQAFADLTEHGFIKNEAEMEAITREEMKE